MSETYVAAAIIERATGNVLIEGECKVAGDLLGPFTPVSDSVDLLTKHPGEYRIKIEHDIYALRTFEKRNGHLHFTIG